jgi:predicted dehydrogenase
MCDHTFCYTPAVRKIRELVRSGEIGDLHFFDSVRINLGLVQPDIDVLWDLAPHDISILESILPPGVEPLSVAAHAADPIGTGRACVAFMTLQLSGGAIAHCHLNWLSPTKVRTTMIGGSKRALVWDDLNPLQKVTVYDRGVDLVPAQDARDEDRTKAFVSYRTGDLVSPAIFEREALSSMVEEFAACIQTGRPSLTDGRSGLRVLDILEAASRSMELNGAPVPLRGAEPGQAPASGELAAKEGAI